MALIGTIIIKTTVIDPNFTKGTLVPLLSSLPEQVMDLLNGSDILLEFVVGLPIALISPLIFVVLFVVFRVLAGIVYLLILLFARKAIKKIDKKKIPYTKARSIAWSAVASFLALLVILIPVTFYGGLVDDVIDAVTEIERIDGDTRSVLTNFSNAYIKPITEGSTVGLFRAFGGDMIINEMTSITIEGEVIHLKSELNAMATVVGNFMALAKEGAPGSYGTAEAESLVVAVKSLTDSKLLTTVASQAVVLLTDDMVNGDASIPMADNEMFGSLITKMVTIVHNDAEDMDKFKEDLVTVAEMGSEFIKGGVLSNMNDTDALMDELAGGSTIKNVILVFGENENMKCLIPEVTNIGIKAIANAVDVKENEDQVYNELMSTIAADLNSVKDLDDEAKVAELSPKLTNAFDHAGIVVDKQVIDLYSVAMIQGIVNEEGQKEITSADVQAFFVAYAESADRISTPDLVAGVDDANSAPAVLARLIYNLSAQDVESEDYNEENIAALLDIEAQAMLGTNEGALYEAVVGVTLKRNIDSFFADDNNKKTEYSYAIQKKFYTISTFENTVALQNAEKMRERTLLIFMDEVVIDVEAVKDFDPAIEAEAIGGIFSRAGGLLKDVSGDVNIGTMATSVGGILNSLRDSETVGEERTTNLFIAILQCSMVRDAANMDIGTATQLGVKGTAQNADGTPVDYERTFKTISNTMDVLQNLVTDSGDVMSQDDLAVVLKDLTPQTAGMIQSYITEDRLAEDYGLDTEQSATAAPLISDIFGYMGNADMTEEESKKEAEALNDVMTLVTGASDRVGSGESTAQTVFGSDPNTSVMGKEADETVDTFMASESFKYSLENNSEDLENDPFGLQDMMDNDSTDKADLMEAMKNHYEASEDKEQDAADLTNLGKLFGLNNEEMNYIFGGNN